MASHGEVERTAGPTARVTRRAADRVRAGHLWVYRSDVDELRAGGSPAAGGHSAAVRAGTGEAGQGAGAVPPGALVTVVDGRGLPLGTALYSDASEICLRVVSRRAGLGRAEYLADAGERVRAALALRRELVPEAFAADGAAAGGETDACRLVFSEADGLPGIVVDRYGALVVVQLLIQGTAQEDVRAVLREVLAGQTWVGTVVERPDGRMRELERLEAPAAEVLFSRAGAAETAHALVSEFRLNGLRFGFDAGSGQKTGAFLDQRLNYAAAARWAAGAGGAHGSGRALDVCTYQGGFALHLARVCRRVTGVDASRAALEVADANRERNAGLISARVDWLEADAFELLRDYEQAGERFATVVLDPPAFAKSKRAAEGAIRGYKELNLRALKMLAPGGILVTCSCSHHVGMEEFVGVVRAAAEDAGRRVQLLEMRGAAPDHPAIVTLPETSYLKCLICRVE